MLPIANRASRLKLPPNPAAITNEDIPMRRTPFSRLSLCAAAIGALAITAFAAAPSRAAEDAVIIPAPAMDAQASDGIQTAVIAGGCFWGVQGVFQHTSGVINAVSGYAGGSKATADYNMVSTGSTGHAESVEIKYDPKKITYGKILQIFFSVAHDPTQLNRQGPDSGTQYRSAIFYADPDQQRVAKAYIAQLQGAKSFSQPIVTEVAPLNTFYAAEDYHQDYLAHHPENMYIVINDLPKLAQLRKQFPDLYVSR